MAPRPNPVAPAAGEPAQAPADDVAGEVLLSDADLGGRPPQAKPMQKRQDHLGQGLFDAEVEQEAIKRGLSRRFVEAIEAALERSFDLGQSRR